jgi:hypothetical protein
MKLFINNGGERGPSFVQKGARLMTVIIVYPGTADKDSQFEKETEREKEGEET